MNLAEHPTVRRFREGDRPDNAEQPKALDAPWLRQLCLDCGADDAGLVEISRPALDEQRADILQLDASTLSRNIKPLQAHGWLEVVPEDDARAQPFRLTAQGKRLIEKAVPAWEEAQRRATELLGSEGIALLDRAAKKLRQSRPEA